MNRRVAHKLGGDARSTDPVRILRPAGTLNHKHAPAEPVIAVRAGCDVYTADEVAGDLADPPEEALARNIAAEVGALRHDDPLRWIPASEYVVALTGRPIGRDGKVRCPWHAGGEDRTPSLQAYDDPARGWMGFGCDAGGSIIDFGARLYGIRPRGRGYHEVRQRLARELRARAVAA